MELQGKIDDVLARAEAEIRALLETPDLDPVGQARLASYAYDQGQAVLLPQLVAHRRAAVHRAREGLSAVKLAEELGVTKARIYQILDGR